MSDVLEFCLMFVIFALLGHVGRLAVFELVRRLRRSGGRMLFDRRRYALWRWQDITVDGRLYLRKLYLWRTPAQQTALHWISTEDPDRDPHDHPRSFLSLVLRGGYEEARPAALSDVDSVLDLLPQPARLATRNAGGWCRFEVDGYMRSYWRLMSTHSWRRRWSVAFRRAEDAHDITRVLPGTLTLVLWGPKRREWGFHTALGWIAWRSYIKQGIGE